MGEIINFQPESSDKEEIDLDKVAKEYMEKIRDNLRHQQEEEKDPHLQGVNLKELTPEDLIIYDKVSKGDLSDTDEEFKKYHQKLSDYFLEQKKTKGEDIDAPDYSRMNFLAMIINKSVSNKFLKRHPEKRKAA